ncbi:MAG: polyphosphate:AMP phosphotransferase [Candidatus Nanopelagicales bacterium]|nr:polyphosphate:AMP phosphotransferase [Candidatus Nanopelagicales bacterium]
MLDVAAVGNKVSKAEYKEAVPQLRVDLVNAQYDLRNAEFPLIIWVAGDDRFAANEVVNRINEWMDARFITTHVFAELSEEESARPQLWRLWRTLPPKGGTAVFAGGLMRMISMRLLGEIGEREFSRWTSHVAKMQSELVADGALVLKFYLHTPEKEQRKRLRRAERNPDDGWWVDERDWVMLEQMGGATPLVERLLRETSTVGATWTVVESTNARYRDLTVARTILAALTARLEQPASRGPELSPAIFGDVDGEASVLNRVDLSKALDRETYRQQLVKYQARLHQLAIEARERGVGTVLAFEGWDAAGKGGVIRRITGSLEAGDYRVVPVAAPTEEENRYHYLWRFWRDVPPAGKLVIFDRTWYGRLLVERIEGFAQPAEWQRAYEEINDFEEQLVERGYYVAKFWLHISPEEQMARFKAREVTPYKKYKITEEDYRNRDRWDEYVKALDQAILRTSSEGARWHVVPANDKPFARVSVLKTITKGLERALKRA